MLRYYCFAASLNYLGRLAAGDCAQWTATFAETGAFDFNIPQLQGRPDLPLRTEGSSAGVRARETRAFGCGVEPDGMDQQHVSSS